MELAEVMNRWLNALGGRDALARVNTVYQHQSIATGGLQGEVQEWQKMTGERRQALSLGDVYSSLAVFNGQVAWTKDQTGNVRELAAQELSTEITTAYLSSFSHFFTDRLSGEVTYLGEQENAHVLELRPEGGHSIKVFLDVDTFLPIKQSILQEERSKVIRFSNWREVDGVKFPFELKQSTGEAAYDVSLEVQEVQLNDVFDATGFEKPESSATAFLKEPRVSLPFWLTTNHIFVKGRIRDSKPLNVIIDTGAGGSVINSRTARDLGLMSVGKLGARGSGEGSQDMGFIKDISLALGTLSLENLTLIDVDMSHLEPQIGHTMDVILGYEILSRAVLDIDYSAKILTLHRPDMFTYRGSGVSIPFTLQNNHPHIQADILLAGRAPIATTFMVDTGAGGALSLNKPFVNAHRVRETVDKVLEYPPEITGVGGMARRSEGRIKGLQMGGFDLRDIVVSFEESDIGGSASPNLAGLIGGDILKRFRVVFDYARQVMLLEPNERYHDPFIGDTNGLRLIAEAPDFKTKKVQRVLPDSPAAQAGIQTGDSLIAVDGKFAEDVSLNDLLETLKETGRTQFELKRGTESFSIELDLEPLI